MFDKRDPDVEGVLKNLSIGGVAQSIISYNSVKCNLPPKPYCLGKRVKIKLILRQYNFKNRNVRKIIIYRNKYSKTIVL